MYSNLEQIGRINWHMSLHYAISWWSLIAIGDWRKSLIQNLCLPNGQKLQFVFLFFRYDSYLAPLWKTFSIYLVLWTVELMTWSFSSSTWARLRLKVLIEKPRRGGGWTYNTEDGVTLGSNPLSNPEGGWSKMCWKLSIRQISAVRICGSWSIIRLVHTNDLEILKAMLDFLLII